MKIIVILLLFLFFAAVSAKVFQHKLGESFSKHFQSPNMKGSNDVNGRAGNRLHFRQEKKHKNDIKKQKTLKNFNKNLKTKESLKKKQSKVKKMKSIAKMAKFLNG